VGGAGRSSVGAVARLVALDLPGGAPFVDALQRVWERGDAVFPLDRRMPPAGRVALLAAMRPAALIDADGEHTLEGGAPTDGGDAAVLATSGSTGTPKGVILTHDAVAAAARATSARLAVTTADTWLACLPLAHAGGFSVVTRALLTGTPLVVHDGFDAAAVDAADATLTSLVPTALARIDASRFRAIVVGGSRPPAHLPANAVTTYGLTETLGGVVYDRRPLAGVELRVAADGEVLVRGAMVTRGYRDGSTPVDTAGWLHTGDLGSVDAAGRLQVAGRRAELIITGGENVWPEQVERAIAGMPDVADVAVAGVPDPEWGQRVVAWIVPAGDPPSLAAVRDAVGEVMPRFAAPRQVLLVAQIPRTALGKVARHRLPRQPSADQAGADQAGADQASADQRSADQLSDGATPAPPSIT
jgi:o-succinylbenzoate---CoA ligase